jgi:hypothetical protein
MQKDDSIPSDGTKADSEQKDEDLFVRQHRSKPNVICRFLSEWFRKRKIRKFEREFDKYYTGLLIGDLYDAKIRLLTKMKKDKHLWLKKYLETKQSVPRQIDEVLSNGI